MPVLFSHRNQSIDLLCKSIDDFYMRATLALNGLSNTETELKKSVAYKNSVYLDKRLKFNLDFTNFHFLEFLDFRTVYSSVILLFTTIFEIVWKKNFGTFF